MKHAVVVSPRLGDAVVACGATLAGLSAGGWQLTLVTVFTAADRLTPAGDADEVARRRDGDRVAAGVLGVAEVAHLPLAPPRVAADDRAAAAAAAALGPVLDAARPDRVFAPLPAAAHDERRVTGDALRWLDHPAPVVRFRNVAEAVREGGPGPVPLPDERGIPVAALLDRKLDACAAYGPAAPARDALRAFAEAEGRRLGADGPAEALVEPAKDRRKRRPGEDEDDKAALVRALRGGLGLTR